MSDHTYRTWADAHMGERVTLNVRLANTCPHGKLSRECCGYPEWLQVIHAINASFEGNETARQEHGFGGPLATYDWWTHDGTWTEEYPEWRVLLRGDGSETVNVQAKTEDAKLLLKAAVEHVTRRIVDDDGMTVRYAEAG